MSRLPSVGGDNNTWGNILNDFLLQEHKSDGSHKTIPISKGGTGAVTAADARTNLGVETPAGAQAKADAVVATHDSDPAAHGLALSSVAPTSPQIGERWLSSSFQDLRISSAISDRQVVLTPSLAWEGTTIYEPRAWLDTSGWHMIYTGGWDNPAIGYATCPVDADPLSPGNWTKNPTPILGQGYGGIAGAAVRGSIYIENGILYLYFADDLASGDIRVATGADALHLTVQSADAVTKTAAMRTMALSGVIKDGSTYRMLFCASRSDQPPGYWASGYATGTSPTGPFTVQAFPLTIPNSYKPGLAWFAKEGTTFIAWQHEPDATLGIPTRVYRITSTDCINWSRVPLEDPLIAPVIAAEMDQVADPWPAVAANGTTYTFWDGVDNQLPAASIVGSVARPILKEWDGGSWVPVHTSEPLVPLVRYKSGVLLSDFTTTTTGSFTPITGLSVTYIPARNEIVQVRLRAYIKTSIAGTVKIGFTISPTPFLAPNAGINNPVAGAEDFSTGYRTLQLDEVYYLRAGVSYTFQATCLNAQSGATTTVSSATGYTNIAINASSIR